MNNGECNWGSDGSYSCLCPYPYTGFHCETPANAPYSCHPLNPCQNGGLCTMDASGQISCTCPHGHTGGRCEIAVVPTHSLCLPNPCQNGGICAIHANNYQCACPQGFQGRQCEYFVSINAPVAAAVCEPNPCRGDCVCIPSCRHSSGYFCQSASGYLGKNCTIPPPRVRCDPNAIVVTVEDSFVREYELGMDDASLSLAQTADGVMNDDRTCGPSFDGSTHTFTIGLPFSRCGTQATHQHADAGESSVEFVNNIWLNRGRGGTYDMPVPVISFDCTYNSEYTVVASIQPAFNLPPVFGVQKTIMRQGSIIPCKVSYSCPKACPEQYSLTTGVVYTVGEMIHLNIGSDEIQGVVALQDLFLSCEGAPMAGPVVTLISNGCPHHTIPTVVSQSGLSRAVCVSFQVPRLKCPVFYIHAKLEQCPPQGCVTSSTMAGCSMSGRKKRDLVQAAVYDAIGGTFGPVYTIEGSPGAPHEILFPDYKIVNATSSILEIPDGAMNDVTLESLRDAIVVEGSDRKNKTAVMVIVVSSVCLTVTAIILAFMYFRFLRGDKSTACL